MNALPELREMVHAGTPGANLLHASLPEIQREPGAVRQAAPRGLGRPLMGRL